MRCAPGYMLDRYANDHYDGYARGSESVCAFYPSCITTSFHRRSKVGALTTVIRTEMFMMCSGLDRLSNTARLDVCT